jgi:acetolactate synthase-1/2/3 large subunit
VKHNFLVQRVEDLAIIIKKAFFVASSGRPGPVVVDIPKDVTAALTAYEYPERVEMRSYKPTTQGHAGQIKRAAELLLSAKKPMIYSGGGAIIGDASRELTEFCRLLGYPVTNTLMGLGAYPGSDPQFVGMLGMHGTYEANMAMHHCDVLIAIGARFDDRVTGDLEKFCPEAKIIHIDIDPASIAKNVSVDVPIVGAVSNVLKDLIDVIKATGHKVVERHSDDWWRQIDKWREIKCLDYDQSSALIKPQSVIESLYRVTKGDAYVTSDVGQHQMWAAQYYPFDQPRRWINSGGLGTMGFGLPSAMGVQLAFPDATVACVTGEASFQMCIQELSTCLQYRLPIKIVSLNNRYLGMVRQWQEFFYESRYSHSYSDALPDFVKLAESYGHIGMRIDSPADVDTALDEAFAMTDRLVVMDFITDQTENVYPMIAAGKGQHEMHLAPNDRELA